MENTFLKILFSVLSLILAAWTYTRWQKKKNFWLLLAVIVAILAAATFWLSLGLGIYLAVLAAALLLLGLWTKRGKQ